MSHRAAINKISFILLHVFTCKSTHFTCAFIVGFYFILFCSFCPKYHPSLISYLNSWWRALLSSKRYKRGWISCASFQYEGSGFDDSPLLPSVLHDKISLCGTRSFLHPCIIVSLGASDYSGLLFFLLAEETSQFRSYQSLTWDLACWECFWGCS